MPGSHTFAPLVLTPEQRHRRSLYFQPPPTESTATRLERTAVVSSAEVQSWLTRELQAITLEADVKVLCQVVLGCLAAVAQSAHTSGRRYCALAFCIRVPHGLSRTCCSSIDADKEGTIGKHSPHFKWLHACCRTASAGTLDYGSLTGNQKQACLLLLSFPTTVWTLVALVIVTICTQFSHR